MLSSLAGLFVGKEESEAIRDDLDLERWFRLPKSHERRIPGRHHAGVRLVPTGATSCRRWTRTLPTPRPFTVEDLLPDRASRDSPFQTEALKQRTIMRTARSKKQRPALLADLERRYRELPSS